MPSSSLVEVKVEVGVEVEVKVGVEVRSYDLCEPPKYEHFWQNHLF